MKTFSIEWKVEEQHDGMLLRNFLMKKKQISRSALKSIKTNGALYINGESAKVVQHIKGGDCILVEFPKEERSQWVEGKQVPLDMIYEDDHLLVLNKQAGLQTIPSMLNSEDTLANGIVYYYEKNDLPYTFHPVNRLDRDTTGLMMVAKHRYAHDLLTKQQKNKSLSRRYMALVHGTIESDTGSVDKPIGRKEGSIIERQVTEAGKEAVTHYRVLKTVKDVTLVSLELETGRTHQIRVHMASLGHPLLGDDLYGGSRKWISRQALHSSEMTFYHPFIKEPMTFQADLPEDIKKVIDE